MFRKGRAVLAFVVRLKSFYPLVRFLGALVIAWIVSQLPVNYLEGALYDARMRANPFTHVSDKIVTIAVDTKTMGSLSSQDLKVSDNNQLLKQLITENPKAIMILNDPLKWAGTQKEKLELAKTAQALRNLYFATDQLTPVSSYGKMKFPAPFQNLKISSAPITRDNISFAGDKVSRRLMISFEGQKTLQTQLAELVTGNFKNYRGQFEADGSNFTYTRFYPTGSIKPLSFIDVRDGRFPKGSLADKIVIIGNDNQLDSEDYLLTPYSRDPLAMSKLEAQGDIINTLIQNNGIMKSSPLIDFIFTALVSYLTVLIVWSAKPLNGILLLIAQAIAIGLISYILFTAFGVWINATYPLISIFVSYYFFIPYRLILENKRSWEFQQKNKLLTQVEELKTNFMSMMSHDLKTPLARIQGMAEIALGDSTKLAAHQKEALNTIMQSSEELSGFIGSILDLSRIESKEMKLNKTSRDINAIINDVVKKYDFAARAKNIKLATELDPLFSIKVDVDLIRQVIANLVENAIKYSPPDTTVTISSKEENGFIKVFVKDQGGGIPKADMDNIFLKFYRSKESKASSVKGSGLGLYLAKYFVELHDGQISVDSVPEQGSIFSVQLPV